MSKTIRKPKTADRTAKRSLVAKTTTKPRARRNAWLAEAV